MVNIDNTVNIRKLDKPPFTHNCEALVILVIGVPVKFAQKISSQALPPHTNYQSHLFKFCHFLDCLLSPTLAVTVFYTWLTFASTLWSVMKNVVLYFSFDQIWWKYMKQTVKTQDSQCGSVFYPQTCSGYLYLEKVSRCMDKYPRAWHMKWSVHVCGMDVYTH